MANYLILNKPQVFNGLGTLTYTVPAGTDTQLYSIQVMATFPGAVAQNSNAPTNTGINYGAFPYFGAGSGMSLGSGTGGGGEGFTGGDLGTGHGGTGQGFGAGNSYQQPPSESGNAIAASPVTSTLSIVVAKNAVTQYTSTAPVAAQSAAQFKTAPISLAAGDSVTVAATSSASVDNQLSGINLTVAIQQGF